MNLTQERLHELLDYNPGDGVFVWRRLPGRGRSRGGTVAGCLRPDGYRCVNVDYKLYLAHRLAFLYAYGRWPAEQIDHINRIKDDNRICNLREATNAQNSINRLTQRNNRLGICGVYFARGKYVAGVTLNGRTTYLGRFVTAQEAAEAHRLALVSLHGEEFLPVAA
jgi:hypothetical protein